MAKYRACPGYTPAKECRPTHRRLNAARAEAGELAITYSGRLAIVKRSWFKWRLVEEYRRP